MAGARALITGGASGIGEATARHLSELGVGVALLDRNAERLASVADRLGAPAAVVDVTDPEAVRGAIEQSVRELGGLDVFVSNAGILISGDSLEFDVARWRRVIDVNLVGYFICAREAARAMLQTGGGSIIQINSKSGKKGSFRNSAYAASKFGGIGVTQSLALEFAEQGVRINSVCPGNLLDSPLWVDSLFKQYAANQGISEAEVRQKYIDQVPMKRACQYRDVTNVVVFLASDDASYMTGQAINVTGGQEMR